MSVIAAVLCLSLLMLPCAAAAQGEPSERRVASVDGKALFQSDLDFVLEGFRERAARSGRPPTDADASDLREAALDQLIARELLFQKAQKEGIAVDDTLVQSQLEKIRGGFPDEQSYREGLARMGTSPEKMAQGVAQQLVIQAFVRERLEPAIVVTPQESRAFYTANPDRFQMPDSVKASHILVKVDAQADEKTRQAARDKIAGIEKELTQGADFAELAKRHSECPSAASGGDLGYFGRGQMVKPFEEAAFSLETGIVSPPVVTDFGYHLIRVTDRKPAGTLSFEEAQEKIESFLRQQKRAEAINRTLEELKKESKIEKF